MRHIEPRKMNAAHEHRLIAEFRSAAFGDFCQTLSFITMPSSSAPQKTWMEGLQEAGGSWKLILCSCDVDAGDNDTVKQIIADQGLSFFEAVKQMAEFEYKSLQNGEMALDEDGETQELGDLYFRPFAVREAIGFNATENTPVQSVKGHLPTNDEFTIKMRRDIKQAWAEKQRAFRMPAFDISHRLKTVEDGLSAEQLKNYLRTKESLPKYVRLFEQFLSEYKECAETGYKYGTHSVDSAHDDLEKCIDEFPENSFPAKEDLRENAAKMYVYFILQSLQAGYHRAKIKDNNASEYLEESVMPKLAELESYYKRRTKAVLPPAASMAKLIMQDNPIIEGTPPADILENYNVLKDWQKTMESGHVLPDAKLPETLPLGHYIPLQYDKKALKTDKQTLELAEQIVDISGQLERVVQLYHQWLASDCKNEGIFDKLAAPLTDNGVHEQLEHKIDELPDNNIVDKDALIEMSARFWTSAEIWRLKAKFSEDTDEVKTHIDTVGNYMKRRISKTKSTKLPRNFKTEFNKQALAIISDPTKKIPATVEEEIKQWMDNLTEFVAAFKNNGTTPQVSTVPKGPNLPSRG